MNKCEDCGWVCADAELDPIRDRKSRVGPGEAKPAGQCPQCGALCYPTPEHAHTGALVIDRARAWRLFRDWNYDGDDDAATGVLYAEDLLKRLESEASADPVPDKAQAALQAVLDDLARYPKCKLSADTFALVNAALKPSTEIWYVAVAANTWGRGRAIASAQKELRKAGGKLATHFVYRFEIPAGDPAPYVDAAGGTVTKSAPNRTLVFAKRNGKIIDPKTL